MLSASTLHAQDRSSARFAGLNPNLAGTFPDAWTDAWRSPARVRPTLGVEALAGYRHGDDDGSDVWAAGLRLSPGRELGLVVLLQTAEDTAGERLFHGSAGAGFGLGRTRLGARVEAVRDESDPAGSATGAALAAGLHAFAEFGSVEIWGEWQAPDEDAGNTGYAGEIVLASPEPEAAAQRLEPVIAARAGRHEVEPFGVTTGGPVTWYEVSLGMRREYRAAGMFALAVRRGEWKARSACAPGDTACLAVVDPAVGTHAATSIDSALEIALSTSLQLRAGGSWSLDGAASEYEDLWPQELRRVGALRPGSVRGAYFGLGLRPAPTLRIDLYGYPGFLDDHGASRRVGKYGAQVSLNF